VPCQAGSGHVVQHLNEQQIKPHKVRYYLERRDPEFKQKMAEALCVYREVKLIKETASAAKQEPSDAVAIISYDEKPGTWLADQPVGRFEFTFTPKHGSWLNLVEGFFSKLARSVLRHIRVASKQELKDRIMAAMDEFNRNPVVHTWFYKLDQAA
jgi:hypothetical protein